MDGWILRAALPTLSSVGDGVAAGEASMSHAGRSPRQGGSMAIVGETLPVDEAITYLNNSVRGNHAVDHATIQSRSPRHEKSLGNLRTPRPAL
jgi:hypothetical protein